MTQCTATFETGTNGNTIATSDPGSSNAWDTVTIGANVTVTYDSTNPAHGGLGAKFASAAAPGVSFLQWTTSLGTLPATHYGRFYLYLSAAPSATTRLFSVYNTDANVCCEVRLQNTGKLVATDGAAATTVATSALSTATMYRVEYEIFHDTAVGTFTLKVYVGDSQVEQTSLGATVSGNTRVAGDRIKIGFPVAAPAASFSWWTDDVVAGATSYPGPAVTAVDSPSARSSQSFYYYS